MDGDHVPFGSTAAHEPRGEQRGEPPRRGGTNENRIAMKQKRSDTVRGNGTN